jgi:AmiR/NasT family two-component response regulator
MTTALLFLNGPANALGLQADFDAAGIACAASLTDSSKLLRDVIQHSPDVLICMDRLPNQALFDALLLIAEHAPCPILMFTNDGDAGRIALAVQANVHAYVVNAYDPARLRPLIYLAMARFEKEQLLAGQMRELSSRFEERKMVDRAKGILMRAQQISDDDAYQMLRTASMHTNQRLGQVSQHIIHSARFAEDLNRSAQLRMFSQRLIKLVLLDLAGQQNTPGASLNDSLLLVDASLAALAKNLSQPTFGDLLSQTQSAWTAFRQVLQLPAQAEQVAKLDALGEVFLQQAERLTASLENAAAMAPLRLLNQAGRQRMLSQRYAKYALLLAFGNNSARAAMARVAVEFDTALHDLSALPLSSIEIRTGLANAALCWQQMQANAAAITQANAGASEDSRLQQTAALAQASEQLLELFESLTQAYERSLQMLVG